MLIGEHLLVHETHRGVTVSEVTADDIVDVYKLRELIEVAAIMSLHQRRLTAAETSALRASLDSAERAAAQNDWVSVGTANLNFHSGLAALYGSVRAKDFFKRLMTEMRLGFLAVGNARALHEPYMERNQSILTHILEGELDRASEALREYLKDAMSEIVEALKP